MRASKGMTHGDLHRWQMIAAGLYECRECGSEFNLIKRKPKEKPICTICKNKLGEQLT
jgi:DNA-directed RNA polymerase subunit RPC12/RpoP